MTTPTSAPSEAEIVLTLRTAGCVFAEDEAALLFATARSETELATMVQRRVSGEPLEVILGWAEFDGVRVAIDPGVFVPRQRTAFLVARAAALAGPGCIVLDLCCGSGALGAALAARNPDIRLYASDIEPSAVRCARRNLGGLGTVFEGDLYAALPVELRGRVDILMVNAPYVPTDAVQLMPPEARDHEPAVALDGGPDGLDVHRRVAAEAPNWLARGGFLLIEVGREQALAALELLARCGFAAHVAEDEELGATVVVGALLD